MSSIHPSASIAQTAVIGKGVRIAARVIVHEDAIIGDGVILEEGVYVGRHSLVGNRTQIVRQAYIGDYAQLGEDVFVGQGVYIAGSDAKDPSRIGSDSNIAQGTCIGPGAQVSGNVPQRTTIEAGDRYESEGMVALEKALNG